jgi:hypothetical protein
MPKIKPTKPTTVAECVDGFGFTKRSDAIYRMNEWTRKTDMQHDIVKLSDGKWYVYNRVPVAFRPLQRKG